MSHQSGYYLVQIGDDGQPVFDTNGQPIPDGSIVLFPVIGRWGRTIKTRRDAIRLKTERGRTWIYSQASIRTRELIFDCLPTDLSAFQDLDDAVGGDRDPFLYVEDVDASPTGWIFVRKDPDWDEGEEAPVKISSAVTRRVRFILHLEEEPTGTEVTT